MTNSKITWVILGHSLDYMNYAGVLNYAHVVMKDVKRFSAQVLSLLLYSLQSAYLITIIGYASSGVPRRLFLLAEWFFGDLPYSKLA